MARSVPQAELLAAFEWHLNSQTEASDETSYNALADVMDRIVGFCGLEVALYNRNQS